MWRRCSKPDTMKLDNWIWNNLWSQQSISDDDIFWGCLLHQAGAAHHCYQLNSGKFWVLMSVCCDYQTWDSGVEWWDLWPVSSVSTSGVTWTVISTNQTRVTATCEEEWWHTDNQEKYLETRCITHWFCSEQQDLVCTSLVFSRWM